MSKDKTDGGAFAVGRGKPPQHTRFKPGQSGNPGGRRRGSQNLQTVLQAVLASEIEITENGRKRRVSVVEALIKCQVQQGLRGSLRAIESLLDRADRYEAVTAEPAPEIAAEDAAIMARLLAGRLANDEGRSAHVQGDGVPHADGGDARPEAGDA